MPMSSYRGLQICPHHRICRIQRPRPSSLTSLLLPPSFPLSLHQTSYVSGNCLDRIVCKKAPCVQMKPRPPSPPIRLHHKNPLLHPNPLLPLKSLGTG